MKTLRRTLWALAFCGIALFSAEEAGAVSSGSEARRLLQESADLIEQQGFVDEALDVRDQLAILSDDELLDAYENIDLEALVLAQAQALAASQRASTNAQAAAVERRRRVASARSAGSAGDPARTLQSADLQTIDWVDVLGTGNGSIHPNLAKGERADSSAKILNWIVIRSLRAALQLSFSALQVARDAFPVCDTVAGQAYLAGGFGVCAGGNGASACMPLAITVTVLQAAFTIARSELNYEIAEQESTDYLDDLIDSAEIELVAERTGYLNGQLIALDDNLVAYDGRVRAQLALHDEEMKQRLETHDVEIQQRLEAHDLAIKAWLRRIQDKANLALKTQMENMLTSNGGARSGVAYLERLQEVCNLASEAISDSTAAGYKVSPKAHELLADGLAQIGTDPKRAHDDCRSAFQLAATRAIQRLPGFGGRK